MAQTDQGELREMFERRSLLFDVNATPPTVHLPSLTFWDNDVGAVAVMPDIDGEVLRIGQTEWVRVRNQTGSTLLQGKAVYVNGNDSPTRRPTVALAKADDDATSRAVGVLANDIVDGSDGFVTVRGLIHNLDTTPYNAGQLLYLSPTTAGEMTATRPDRPNAIVPLCMVAFRNLTQGVLEVQAMRSWQWDALGANYARSEPNNVINTNYRPSLTRPVEVRVSVTVAIAATVSAGSPVAEMELRADPGAGTPGTRRDVVGVQLGIGVLGNHQTKGTLTYRLPPGWSYRIVPVLTQPTVGTSTAIINTQVGAHGVEETIL